MRNIKKYESSQDFLDAENFQPNYVVSIEPGVAYVEENQSVKYNLKPKPGFDLTIVFGVFYTADTQTSAFIDALYAGTAQSFKILAIDGDETYVFDETSNRFTSNDSVDYVSHGRVFSIYPTSPKTYAVQSKSA
jgi:hypothetical protein